MKICFRPLMIAAVLLVSAYARPAYAQAAPPGGHLGHHPDPGAAAMPPATDQAPPAAGQMTSGGQMTAPAASAGMAGNPPGAAPAGGMGAEMGEMMKQMGGPPAKEIYPTLMALPDGVTPEERARIEQLAQDRMKAGSAALSSGLAKLSDSTSNENYPAMQQATEQMREGLAEFEAGVAARRALAEGTAPRNLALDWFKREMNLASPRSDEPRTLFGVTPFHLFTMALLILFGLSMLVMYFFKMRRAAALFGRLGPDAKPAPGSAPELAGKPGPPTSPTPATANA